MSSRAMQPINHLNLVGHFTCHTVTLKTVPMFGHLGEIDQLCNGKKLQKLVEIGGW